MSMLGNIIIAAYVRTRKTKNKYEFVLKFSLCYYIILKCWPGIFNMNKIFVFQAVKIIQSVYSTTLGNLATGVVNLEKF